MIKYRKHKEPENNTVLTVSKKKEKIMYKVIIELKKDISEDVLKQLNEVINAAFENRGGKVSDSRTDSLYRFEFAGDYSEYGCLDLGTVLLKENELFWNNVAVWEWEDEDPDENCNIIKEFSIPVR